VCDICPHQNRVRLTSFCGVFCAVISNLTTLCVTLYFRSSKSGSWRMANVSVKSDGGTAWRAVCRSDNLDKLWRFDYLMLKVLHEKAVEPLKASCIWSSSNTPRNSKKPCRNGRRALEWPKRSHSWSVVAGNGDMSDSFLGLPRCGGNTLFSLNFGMMVSFIISLFPSGRLPPARVKAVASLRPDRRRPTGVIFNRLKIVAGPGYIFRQLDFAERCSILRLAGKVASKKNAASWSGGGAE